MRNLMITAGLVLGLGGLSACGGKDKFDEVLGELEGFKTRMCECKDKACAEKVQEDWRAYRKTMKEKLGKDTKPSEAQDKKGKALDEDMRVCRKKFDEATPAPTPTETAPPAPAAPTTP
ncbi:MAG: hypothetical protein IPQ07_43405 [Myxococcales bacterium]|nr:hypothetical protein [Myxococcales bacterium]